MKCYVLTEMDIDDNDWIESIHLSKSGAEIAKDKIAIERGFTENETELYLDIEEREIQP